MTRYIIAALATLMATSAYADDVHGQFAKGNPDVKAHTEEAGEAGSGVGTVTEANVYKGLAKENPDLRGKGKEPTPGTGAEDPSVYENIEPNPDLED